MKTTSILAVLLATGGILFAQQPAPNGPQAPRRDGSGIFGDTLFPPDMVMRNQRLIGLTPDQKQKIREEMQSASAPLTDLQWKKADAEEELSDVLSPAKPDEGKAIAALDKLLKAENDMKRFQLGLMLRIKAILTPEQQQQLAAIRAQKRTLRQGQPGRPPGPQGYAPAYDGDPQGPPPEE